MADKFKIISESGRHLLRIVLFGHWDVPEVFRYKAALDQALQQMRAEGCPSGSISALVDTREAGVQSQDVVAAWQEALGSSDLAPCRLATIVSSALLKRQVGRIAIANQRVFDNEVDAMAWLQSSEDIN